jgi:hypothetical protein
VVNYDSDTSYDEELQRITGMATDDELSQHDLDPDDQGPDEDSSSKGRAKAWSRESGSTATTPICSSHRSSHHSSGLSEAHSGIVIDLSPDNDVTAGAQDASVGDHQDILKTDTALATDQQTIAGSNTLS